MKKWTILFVLLFISLSFSGILAQEEDIETNPQDYYGQTLTVVGEVTIISPNAFELTETEPFDLSPDAILVFPADEASFGIAINNGMRVRVTGMFDQFDVTAIANDRLYDTDESDIADYTNDDYIIYADTVEILAEAQEVEQTDQENMDDAEVVQSDDEMAGLNRTEAGILSETEATSLENDPEGFYGTDLTVEGVANIVSPNVFELVQTQPFDLSPQAILVLPGQDGDFGIDIEDGMRVRVTGRFDFFDLPNLETGLQYDLDDEALAAYGADDFSINATSVTRLAERPYAESASRFSEFTDDPGAYTDQTMTVAGRIAEDVDLANNNFILREEEASGSNRALVLSADTVQTTLGDNTEDFSVNDRVTVIGTVRDFNMGELEDELGYDLDDDLYSQYEGLPVIVASAVQHTAYTDSLDAIGNGISPAEDSSADGDLGYDQNLGSNAATAPEDDSAQGDDVGTDSQIGEEEGVEVPDDSGFGEGRAFDVSVYNDYPVVDATLDDVIDDPSDYYGRIVNVAGTVSSVNLVQNSFYIWDQDLIDADRAVVFAGPLTAIEALDTLEIDDGVAVRGVVRPFVYPDLESELGFDFDEAAYADFEDEGGELAAIIALEIIPNIGS